MAAAPTGLAGAGVEERAGGAATPKGGVDVQVGDPGLRRRPVQPGLDPEADRACDFPVQFGHQDQRVLMLEVSQEDVALRLRVFGDSRSRQILHQRKDGVGVPRFCRPNAHGIDRYSRRKVRRNPRAGQNRYESRFVYRQSTTIVA